jgi:cell division septation protein DedD
MPRNPNDQFDDFDDEEDEGFMTFDARGSDEGMSRGPIILAAIVLLLAAFLAILWVVFNGNKTSNATPEIASQTEAYKEMPMNDTGLVGDDLDKGVYNSVEGLGPPPLEVQASGSEDPLLSASQVATPAAATTVVPKPAASVPKPVTTTTPAAPKPVVSAPKPLPTPAPVVKTVTATPASKPAAVVAAPAAKPAAAPVKSSGVSAQLGSFPSQEQAQKALAQYRARGFKGNATIVSADLGTKGTWYRVRATGFVDRDEVIGFCAKAKAAGAVCIPAN